MLIRLFIAACAVAVVACSSGGQSPPLTPSVSPTSTGVVYLPVGDPLPYDVCSEGFGWVRPSRDDQRRHLASLGDDYRQFASDPGLLFDGAYAGRDAQNQITWHYAIFWQFMDEPEREQYALARSGLWLAAPNTSRCKRDARALTLVIDHEVTSMRFDKDTVWMTARDAPGYFEYVEYALPVDKHSVGFRLVTENGEFIDACCS